MQKIHINFFPKVNNLTPSGCEYEAQCTAVVLRVKALGPSFASPLLPALQWSRRSKTKVQPHQSSNGTSALAQKIFGFALNFYSIRIVLHSADSRYFELKVDTGQSTHCPHV